MKNVLLCGTLAFSISSIAQNVSASKDSLPENPIRLDAIVIEAIRAKKNTPVAFSNVSKKEIQQKNVGQQIPLLLDHLPNVVSSAEDGIGYGDTHIYIRGNNNYRINMTINGSNEKKTEFDISIDRNTRYQF